MDICEGIHGPQMTTLALIRSCVWLIELIKSLSIWLLLKFLNSPIPVFLYAPMVVQTWESAL